MPSITFRRAFIWAVVGLLAAASIGGGAFFSPASDVEAHQPEGLRISQTNVPEPPCPYGHDNACETAPLSQVSLNPYQSEDPHDPAFNTDSGRHYRHEGLEGIAALNRQVLARRADSGAAPKAADLEPKEPGGGVSYAITSDITGLPWLRDGVTPAEAVTRDWLSALQEYNPSLVGSLTRMPFLRDHTPGDLQAIRTLTIISAGTGYIAPNPQYATALVNHAGFTDGGGVDNTEAKIIAVTSIPYLDGNDTLIDLLAGYGVVEEQTRVGRYGNRVNFAVVRLLTNKQNSKLMQSAITATQDAETLMNQALPVDFVGMLVADSPDFAGANNGIHLQITGGFDDGTYSDRSRQRVVAHEIGHYWWGTGDNYLHEYWIAEGAANYIGAYSEKRRFNLIDVFTNTWPCPYYRTIEHLRADRPQYGVEVSYGSLCNYSLGERLFINLDRSTTAQHFTTAFRNLHHRLSTFEDDEIDQGLSLLRAFCPQCENNPRNLGSVGYTLSRYYGEKILTDNSPAVGVLPGLGQVQSVRIQDHYGANRQYGIAQVPASSPDQRRWVRLWFNNVVIPPKTANVYVAMYHEEREPYFVVQQKRPVYRNDNQQAWFYAYLGAPYRRAPGHHWVYIYNENWQKIAEVEYQVIP